MGWCFGRIRAVIRFGCGFGVAAILGTLLVGTARAEPEEENPDDAPSATRPATQPAKPVTQTDIDAIIEKAGKTPPEWWNSVKLNYPATLDLTWPTPPRGTPWNPNKYINQYYISVINPKPALHQQGCKLMQQILTVNKNNSNTQARAMQMLGRIYGIYLGDYARGAFWYRKADRAGAMNAQDVANLGYYYWKLGSKAMALEELTNAPACGQAVRVLGSMGELDAAMTIAAQVIDGYPEDGYLSAGDAYRINGQYKEAIEWYQKLLAIRPPDPTKPGRLQRYQDRARASVQAIQMFQKIDLARTPDGTYFADSIGYRGPVRVAVVVKSGRIEQVRIVQTKEDWPLNALVVMPAQIIDKQSVKGVDTVSSATFTAEAVLNATVKALGGAVK